MKNPIDKGQENDPEICFCSIPQLIHQFTEQAIKAENKPEAGDLESC